ncbi:hypothetical protein FH972_006703 [Carpinus fangiana]|uniref:Uncharacterized protein n=1 Tax=Carpinus fangiana TaxID=176857 RepID=A0A5N6QW36_9ROSI|nr:hypothetical protein FH972_006703 [Carpinus fangiana]
MRAGAQRSRRCMAFRVVVDWCTEENKQGRAITSGGRCVAHGVVCWGVVATLPFPKMATVNLTLSIANKSAILLGSQV